MEVEVQDSDGNVHTFADCFPSFTTDPDGGKHLFIDNDRGMQAAFQAHAWVDIIIRNDDVGP